MLDYLLENEKLFRSLSRSPHGRGFLELTGKSPRFRGRVLDNAISYDEFKSTVESGNSYNQLGVFLREDLVRIDIDYTEGLDNYIKSILPDTTTFKTKRGYHVFFKTDKKFKKGDYKLYNQLNVEVIPPMEKVTVPLPFNDENRYILNDSDPIDLPLEWSIQKPLKQDEKSDHTLPIREGSRDDSIFRIACVLKDRFDEPDLLFNINTYAVNPSLDDKVVQDKWDSANTFEKTVNTNYDEIITDKGFLVPLKAVKLLCENNEIRIVVEQKARIPFLWNGQYWVRGSELEIKDLITEILPDTYVSVENKNKIYKLLLEEPSIRCRWTDFNRNQREIYFLNSVYNLDTCTWDRHRSTNMNTFVIHQDITEDTPIVLPKDSLWYNEFACNTNMTKADIMMLLEYIAYCMIPSTHLKCSLFLTGPTNTGKSILIKQLIYMLGDLNMSSVTMHSLNNRFVSTELFNKLLNEDGDGSGGTLRDISAFKKMTGGDRLLYEEKGEKPFMFTPFAKNIFSFNKLPLQKDENTDAFYGRLRIIELAKPNIYSHEHVTNVLIPSLVELIPYMIYTVLPKIYYAGISNSPNSQIHVNQLYCASDSLQEVLNTYIIESIGENIDKKDLYTLYSDWCIEWEERPLKYREFIREMRAKGYRDIKVEGVACFRDIKIYTGDEDE